MSMVSKLNPGHHTYKAYTYILLLNYICLQFNSSHSFYHLSYLMEQGISELTGKGSVILLASIFSVIHYLMWS